MAICPFQVDGAFFGRKGRPRIGKRFPSVAACSSAVAQSCVRREALGRCKMQIEQRTVFGGMISVVAAMLGWYADTPGWIALRSSSTQGSPNLPNRCSKPSFVIILRLIT